MSRLLLVVLLASACSMEPSGRRSVTVASVIDGDTFDTTDGERIRVLGADAPETGSSGECWGQEAYAWLRDEIDGQSVELELDLVTKDDYDRTLAYVYLGDTLVNGEMLREGSGCLLVIPPNDRYAHYLETLEDSARSSGAGLWTPCGGCDTPL